MSASQILHTTPTHPSAASADWQRLVHEKAGALHFGPLQLDAPPAPQPTTSEAAQPDLRARHSSRLGLARQPDQAYGQHL